MMLLKLLKMAGPLEVQYKLTFDHDSSSKLIYSSIVSGYKLANYSSHNSMAEIVIDAKCPKLRVPEEARVELQGRPVLQVQEGRVRWWDPISTRTRNRFK